MDARTHTAGDHAPTQPCRGIGPGWQTAAAWRPHLLLLGCQPRPQLSALAHNTMARTDRALYQLGEARRGRVTERHSPRPAAHARVGRSRGNFAGCGLRTGHRTLFHKLHGFGCCQHYARGGRQHCAASPGASTEQVSALPGHVCGRRTPLLGPQK